ncbi:MAG: (4Fe-4S)-binding protein [Acidimicrobiales bacterium]
MATRDYHGDGITIHWDSARCQHSGRCVAGSPDVFDPKATPWVDPTGATAAAIAATIDTCPSGALSYTLHPPAATEA